MHVCMNECMYGYVCNDQVRMITCVWLLIHVYIAVCYQLCSDGQLQGRIYNFMDHKAHIKEAIYGKFFTQTRSKQMEIII